MQKLDKKTLWIRLAMVIAIIVLVNFIASFLYKRFDLTSEGRYSLSDSTINLLDKTKHKAYIKIYLDGEDLPSGFLRLRNATEDVLKEMNSESGGKIQYEFINPVKNATNEDERIKIQQELISKGLMPTQLRVKKEDGFKEQLIFPCLQVSVNGKSWPVQILENQVGYAPEYALNNSIISLEYKIANALKKLTDDKVYTIGIMQGHGELMPQELNDLANILTENNYEVNFYDVKQKVLSKQGDSLGSWFPQTTDLLIIAGPQKPFADVEKYRLDQYVMKGGKILWAIDAMDARMDYLRNDANMFLAHGLDLNLEDILFTYGVRVNKNLVQDGQQSAPIPILDEATKEPLLFPWLYSPLLTPSLEHPIGKNLDPVFAQFSSSIDLIQNDIKKTIILSTSQYGRAIPEPARVHLSAVKDKPDFKYFKQPHLPCGVLLEGKFTSAYKNQLGIDFVKKITEAGQAPKEMSVENKMIILSDADILRNHVSSKGEIYPLGFEQYSRQTFANKDFVLNCIEYLIDPNNLLATRNKEIKVRQLDAKRTKTEGSKWKMLNLILPLGLVILFAIVFNYLRRRKWTIAKLPK
ncbi:MAG: gliding motility-associated ABC transporter substrate-binding protein GldG [Chitinophagales bacterium]|nr:gliding motility-associated ABC transporter substrate-binding protein GldG [Chitinophagales bacterium]